MTALYIIGGIILFFVILFSIHLSVILDYGDKVAVTVKWLFITVPVYDSQKPKKEKKKKDKKKDKEKKPEDEKPAEKKPKEPKKGNGLLKQLYLEQGYDGIEKMLYNTGKALSGFFGKLYKTFTFNELYLTMRVVGSDAADTAISYGKLSAWLFPVLGKLVSTCKVKKYDFDISPDFLGNKKEAHFYANMRITPIRVTNAAVVLAVSLLFKVLLKVLFAKNNSKKSAQSSAETENTEKTGSKENGAIGTAEGTPESTVKST